MSEKVAGPNRPPMACFPSCSYAKKAFCGKGWSRSFFWFVFVPVSACGDECGCSDRNTSKRSVTGDAKKSPKLGVRSSKLSVLEWMAGCRPDKMWKAWWEWWRKRSKGVWVPTLGWGLQSATVNAGRERTEQIWKALPAAANQHHSRAASAGLGSLANPSFPRQLFPLGRSFP